MLHSRATAFALSLALAGPALSQGQDEQEPPAAPPPTPQEEAAAAEPPAVEPPPPAEVAAGPAQGPGADRAFDWNRPDTLPPAGVRRYQDVPAGQWMFQLRYEHADRGELLDGEDELAPEQVFTDYEVPYTETGTSLTADGVGLELSWGWTDMWTVFLDVPFTSKEMDNVTDTGATYTTESGGIGDVQLGVIGHWLERQGQRGRFNLGLSLPTGSTDEEDKDATGTTVKLPYVMQSGSGTVDFVPGFTYIAQYDGWSWGAAGQWRIHINTNSDGYAPGDRGELDAWIAKRFSRRVGGSARIGASSWGDYHGADPDIDRLASPLNEPGRQGGDRADAALGLNWFLSDDRLRALSLEVGAPLYQWLDGPQLGAEWFLSFGWRHSF